MKLADYIKETRGEMRHMSWPTRKQAVNYTLLVIGISVATAIVLSLADWAFTSIVQTFILK